MNITIRRVAALAAALTLAAFTAPATWAAGEVNPCAAKTLNPCAAKTLNPCTAKTLNPCAAKTLNPCAAKKPAGRNPCSAKANPCNPCSGSSRISPKRFKQPAGARLASGSHSALVKRGEQLWNDNKLGKTGLACSSCHTNNYGLMKASFDQPFPHYVEMPAQRAGVEQVNAAEMVQFCMIVPMADEPLPWTSPELASLTAYVETIQAGFDPTGANGPTEAANPYNPCSRRSAGANPCNPCAAKHNPCEGKKGRY